EALRSPKGAIAIPQQHTYLVRAIAVGHHEIEMAIAIKVAHRHGAGSGADGIVAGGLKSTVALAQQDTYRAILVSTVGHGEIEMAIAIKVAHRQRPGTGADGVAPSGLKRAIALAQQHTHASRA